MKNKYDIIWFASIDSTNNEALRRIREADGMSVVAAICQTSGRGQRGNTWKSEQGKNLTFSIAIRFGRKNIPAFPAIKQFRLSEATALSLVEFLKNEGIEAKIKWPNDIYVGDRKICGILIENSISGNDLSTSVIGIGLNVNQTSFPADLPNPTSISLENGKTYPDLGKLLEKFLTVFESWFEATFPDADAQADADHHASGLHKRYRNNLYGYGKYLKYNDIATKEQFNAEITDVLPTGPLQLTDESDQIREYNFKEVELILPGKEN